MAKSIYIGLLVLGVTIAHGLLFSFSNYHLIGFGFASFMLIIGFVSRKKKSKDEPITEEDFLDEEKPETPKQGFFQRMFSSLSSGTGRLIISILIISAIIGFYLIQKEKIASFIQEIPWLWSVWVHVSTEIASKSLLGFFYINLLASIFFTSLPSEIFFLAYLGLGHNPINIIVIAIISSTLGQIINYGIGFIAGEGLLRLLLKEKYEKIKNSVDKFGSLVILIGNAIPFPIELITVFLGAMRFSFKKMLIYTVIGRAIKYGTLFFGRNYLMNTLLPKISGLLQRG